MRASKSFLTQVSLFFCLALISLTSMAEGLSATEIRAALNSPDRSDEDKARDEGRKPADVLAYLGVQKGMTVLDVMAAGGWYTEVLARTVGNTGKVYAQNSPAALKMRDGANDKAMQARIENGRLPNVNRLDKDISDLGLNGNVDVAITALNLHDIYNRENGEENAVNLMRAIKDTLKPGGVFGVIDHEGNADADNAKLHRMTSQQAIAVAKKAGFEVDVSNVLRFDSDDHSKMVFDPSVRGKTDRFLLKLTKPK